MCAHFTYSHFRKPGPLADIERRATRRARAKCTELKRRSEAHDDIARALSEIEGKVEVEVKN